MARYTQSLLSAIVLSTLPLASSASPQITIEQVSSSVGSTVAGIAGMTGLSLPSIDALKERLAGNSTDTCVILTQDRPLSAISD